MKITLSSAGWLAAVVLILGNQHAAADQDAFENCPDVFADPAFGAAWYREQCTRALSEYRAQLDAWGIDNSWMSDIQAWDRYRAEKNTRDDARLEQDRRDALERDRLAAERAAQEAEQARIAAARDREAQAYGERQMNAGQKMLNEQNEMLKGLGVNLGGMSIEEDDEDSDEEYSATELAMYQRMVDDGAAPGCKGLSGAALVDCVDEALEADEDE